MKPASHGIAPKMDPKTPTETKEKPTQKTTKPEVKPPAVKPTTAKTPEKTSKKTPCSTYGDKNKCEGMPCKHDEDCASTCCSTAMGNGSQTCHAVIQDSFCPRALAPKVDYSMYVDHKVDYTEHVNSLEQAGLDHEKLNSHYSNDLPVYRGKGGCHVTGFTDQCDGQPCHDDEDCFSGCCGHFVSFSLKRCLPLTDDELCPRFLEPTYRSPVPSQLPPIESTITDMYHIQDRIHYVEMYGNENSITFEEDFCRSHGDSKLCDGFRCDYGHSCRSGCCG